VDEDKIELAEDLLDEYNEAVGRGQHPPFSQAQIARIVSKSTGSSISQQSISRYNAQDMSPKARAERKAGLGHPLLQHWMENECGGLVFYGALHHKLVDTELLQSHIEKRWHHKVNHQFISDLKKRLNISSQRVRFSSEAETNEQTLYDIASVIERIQYLVSIQGVKPEQIYAVDKMFVKDKPGGTTGLGPKGLYDHLTFRCLYRPHFNPQRSHKN
jgi:hypothetical protein